MRRGIHGFKRCDSVARSRFLTKPVHSRLLLLKSPHIKYIEDSLSVCICPPPPLAWSSNDNSVIHVYIKVLCVDAPNLIAKLSAVYFIDISVTSATFTKFVRKWENKKVVFL